MPEATEEERFGPAWSKLPKFEDLDPKCQRVLRRSMIWDAVGRELKDDYRVYPYKALPAIVSYTATALIAAGTLAYKWMYCPYFQSAVSRAKIDPINTKLFHELLEHDDKNDTYRVHRFSLLKRQTKRAINHMNHLLEIQTERVPNEKLQKRLKKMAHRMARVKLPSTDVEDSLPSPYSAPATNHDFFSGQKLRQAWQGATFGLVSLASLSTPDIAIYLEGRDRELWRQEYVAELVVE